MKNMNDGFADLMKEVMKNPELLNGITKNLMNDENDMNSDNPMDAIVEGAISEIQTVVAKINDVIETSESYEALRDEIYRLINNALDEVASIITEANVRLFENTESLDEIKANWYWRQYKAFLDVGFDKEQAFNLLTKENKKTDLSTFNDFLNKISTEVSKQKK